MWARFSCRCHTIENPMWIHPLRISLLVYALTPGGSARDPLQCDTDIKALATTTPFFIRKSFSYYNYLILEDLSSLLNLQRKECQEHFAHSSFAGVRKKITKRCRKWNFTCSTTTIIRSLFFLRTPFLTQTIMDLLWYCVNF